MSRSKKRDEQEALKLDECFKETLQRVRPYIPKLRVAEGSKLCHDWLHKLSCASSQRNLRNEYLFELCGHIKSGHVGGIFARPPQKGPLPPLPRFCDHTNNANSSLSEFSDSSCPVPYDPPPRSIMKQRNNIFSGDRSTDSSSSTNCDRSVAKTSSHRCIDKTRSDKTKFSMYERRIENLTAIVRELQIDKERLKRNLSCSKEKCACKENSNNLTSTIEQLTAEISTLRSRFVEVNNMKDELEKNHREIVEQYKCTMTKDFDELNLRLREACCKNEELDEKVATISGQLEKIICEKKEELITVEENFKEKIASARLHCETQFVEMNRELSLKDEIINEKDEELAKRDKFHRDEILLLNEKMKILQEKLETKIEDEGKLQSFLKEQCSTMKEEFMKMWNDMEISTKAENQSLVDKISSLKKIITKLLKSKEKQSNEFEKKISQVLQAKDLEIKRLELQLQQQHNELSTTLSTEKQCEMDTLVRLLEERYKSLLAATGESVGNQRQNFLEKITFLENEVTCMKNTLDGDIYV